MPVTEPKGVFVKMLSDLRRGTERSTSFFQELGGLAQDPDVKEAVEARVFVAQDILRKLDECFRLIGEKPIKTEGRLHDIIVEDFRREIAEIQSPDAKRLFILMKLSHLAHIRMGEYVALIAAADITGHYAVGVLLESCLGEKQALIERSRRLIRDRVAQKLRRAA